MFTRRPPVLRAMSVPYPQPNPSAFRPIARPPSAIPSHYYPNLAPLVSPLNPMMSYGMIATGLPQMWSVKDPYYRHSSSPEVRLNPPIQDHSTHCCLSGNPCETKAPEKTFCDFGHPSRYESNDRSVQTKAENISNTENNEDLTEKVIDLKLDILDVWQRLSVRQIDNDINCIEALAESVSEQLKRFADNEDITARLQTLKSKIKLKLSEAIANKNKILDEIETQKNKIMQEIGQDYDLSTIDYKLQPFRDLLFSYETVFDQILAGVTKKAESSNCCCKPDDTDLTNESNLNEINQKWKNFAVDEKQVIYTGINLYAKKSNVGKIFGTDLLPIVEFGYKQLSPEAQEKTKSVSETKPESQSKVEMEKQSETPVLRRPQISQSVDRLPNSLPNFKSTAYSTTPVNGPNPTFKHAIDEKADDLIASPSKLTDCSRYSSANASTATLYKDCSVASSGVRIQDQKILIKLKQKYPYVGEGELRQSIERTREMLKRFGGKGFSGLRIPEVIDKVSKFIDTKEEEKLDARQRNTCGICRAVVVSIRDKSILSCSHAFHTDCLTTWTQTNHHCPNCHNDTHY